MKLKKKYREREKNFAYDVCLSFAGRNRRYVESVARDLRSRGIRVFYDDYEQVDLWGKDLYTHLDDVYRHSARYCVMFVSRHYADSVWTNHERKSAQARALKENAEYILPAKFDDTDIPGLPNTVGYVDLNSITKHQLADMIQEKIGERVTYDYFPPIPDRLFRALKVRNKNEKSFVSSCAYRFFSVLQRMTEEERFVMYRFIRSACPGELPENVHISMDLLHRDTGYTNGKLKRILGNLRSLGFLVSCRANTETEENEKHLGELPMFILEWIDLTENGGNATDIAYEMILSATKDYCEEHGFQALQRLDFSQLASVTAVIDKH